MGPKESEPLLRLGVVEGGPDDPTPGVPGWSSTDTEHSWVDVMYGRGRCFGSRAEIIGLTMSFKQTKLYFVI